MSPLKHVGETGDTGARRPGIGAYGVVGAALLAVLGLLAAYAGDVPATEGSLGAAARAGAEEGAAFSAADKHGRFVYLIEFAEPGLLGRSLRAHGERLDPHSSRSRAHLADVQAEQASHVEAMTLALGGVRPEVTHHFLVTHSGLAARLLPWEAEVVRGLPGVVSVERERLYRLNTYRGPTFIGADSIWDGSAVPGGVGTQGEGMVIGMLDGGVASTHPSFANDPACPHGGADPDKLISFLDCASTTAGGLCNGPDPEDPDGHGTHTASTAGGNALDDTAVPPPFTDISGVAPCAHIRSYKVCPTSSCPGANIQAGMDSVLLHGDVDVMNFSISGGTSPWLDNDRRKLDLVDAGVFVAAAAGNTSAGVPDPVGQVNHRGPWVLSVAASTHDGTSGILSASGPGSPPPATQDIAMTRGTESPVGTSETDHPIRHYTGQPADAEGCDASPPFPAGFFTGAGALIHRGTCSFTEKITNAFNAGADWVVIRNNQAGALTMATPGQPAIPAYSMDQTPGDALVAFVDANPSTATFDFMPRGDVLAGFSLRGPTPVPLADLTKPDITGPGVSIYAAVPTAADPSGYGIISGTSMSSPHAAGAATLVRAVHPSWTVSEVKSALMMTAFKGGTKEDGSTAWDPDDVGNGRLDLTKAALAGLVMDETFANYLAADPGTGGDVKTLNLPAVRNLACTPWCTWTRTVRNTLGVATSWNASGIPISPDFVIAVSPANFTFTGSLAETQTLTITAWPHADLTGDIAFGEVVLSEGSSASPDLHMTVAISGVGDTPIFTDGFESGDVSAWTLSVP